MRTEKCGRWKHSLATFSREIFKIHKTFHVTRCYVTCSSAEALFAWLFVMMWRHNAGETMNWGLKLHEAQDIFFFFFFRLIFSHVITAFCTNIWSTWRSKRGFFGNKKEVSTRLTSKKITSEIDKRNIFSAFFFLLARLGIKTFEKQKKIRIEIENEAETQLRSKFHKSIDRAQVYNRSITELDHVSRLRENETHFRLGLCWKVKKKIITLNSAAKAHSILQVLSRVIKLCSFYCQILKCKT